MRTMWRLRVDMSNQWYDLPDLVGRTSYQRDYTPDQDSYLPYQGC